MFWQIRTTEVNDMRYQCARRNLKSTLWWQSWNWKCQTMGSFLCFQFQLCYKRANFKCQLTFSIYGHLVIHDHTDFWMTFSRYLVQYFVGLTSIIQFIQIGLRSYGHPKFCMFLYSFPLAHKQSSCLLNAAHTLIHDIHDESYCLS